jgi:hypothetical protein
MKKISYKIIVSLLLLIAVSCNEPETVVTNIVHPDGSIIRKIEMKSNESKAGERFKTSDLLVPFDSTWTVRDSCEINEDGDTTWIRRVEKLFENVNGINLAYKADSGYNRHFGRHVRFIKRFRWFNTEFRFSEIIDKKMLHGYPIADFMNQEELAYFYSPDSIILKKLTGPDSLKYKAFGDTISKKTDRWMSKSMVSEWIGEFTRLTDGKAGDDMNLSSLKEREDEFVNLVNDNEKNLDSLWTNGILLKEFIGEANALKYKLEADSAISIVTENFWVDFREYSVRIAMPGKVTGTNGFVQTNQEMLWPVKSDFFLTEQYEMWAESKVPNRWAWIVSGLFLLFVLTGIILRLIIKKG